GHFGDPAGEISTSGAGGPNLPSKGCDRDWKGCGQGWNSSDKIGTTATKVGGVATKVGEVATEVGAAATEVGVAAIEVGEAAGLVVATATSVGDAPLLGVPADSWVAHPHPSSRSRSSTVSCFRIL